MLPFRLTFRTSLTGPRVVCEGLFDDRLGGPSVVIRGRVEVWRKRKY